MVIDRLTFQRTAAVIEASINLDLINAVQMATCAVAEEIQKNEQREAGETGVIASEKQGLYAVTYVEADAPGRQPMPEFARLLGSTLPTPLDVCRFQ